jgi:hypothetical protein
VAPRSCLGTRLVTSYHQARFAPWPGSVTTAVSNAIAYVRALPSSTSSPATNSPRYSPPPDRATWHGRRDHALLVPAAQTGPRVSEPTARIEDAIVAVYAAYATAHGHALVDRDLYVQRERFADPDRMRRAGFDRSSRTRSTRRPGLAPACRLRQDSADRPRNPAAAGHERHSANHADSERRFPSGLVRLATKPLGPSSLAPLPHTPRTHEMTTRIGPRSPTAVLEPADDSTRIERVKSRTTKRDIEITRTHYEAGT